jgi:hypothetical protein
MDPTKCICTKAELEKFGTPDPLCKAPTHVWPLLTAGPITPPIQSRSSGESLPPAGSTPREIARHYLFTVLDAEDENQGCELSERALFACQWNNRPPCPECAELQRRVEAYGIECIEAALRALTAGPVAPPPDLERVEQALRAATRELVATYGWENPRLQSLYDQITGVLGEAPRGAARSPQPQHEGDVFDLAALLLKEAGYHASHRVFQASAEALRAARPPTGPPVLERDWSTVVEPWKAEGE